MEKFPARVRRRMGEWVADFVNRVPEVSVPWYLDGVPVLLGVVGGLVAFFSLGLGAEIVLMRWVGLLVGLGFVNAVTLVLTGRRRASSVLVGIGAGVLASAGVMGVLYGVGSVVGLVVWVLPAVLLVGAGSLVGWGLFGTCWDGFRKS